MNLKLEILLLLLSPIPISSTIALSNNTLNYTLPPISTSPPRPPPSAEMAPFKPSITVIVAVLTTMFSVTFLLLLYAKHCKRGNGNDDLRYSGSGVPASAGTRKTSGVDRTTIESLPVFRFGALRGEKDGLECAVCLNRFEQTEVLRLLPKCKHAFHVECVDTWLEAHSTCPLCRYRVEPEDILLCRQSAAEAARVPSPPSLRRVSGRHSSAGERGLQIVVEPPPRCSRGSCDSWLRKKKGAERKDDVLLEGKDRSSDRRKLEHRIVIGEETEMKQRWSDVQPSDLLYLRSEMIMSDSRRFSASGSRPLKQQSGNDGGCSGRGVINGRSVSEITGLSRFKEETTTYRRREGVLSRWLAWVPQSQSHVDTLQLPPVR